MAKKKAQFSAGGIKMPDYKIIKSGMKPVSIGGIKRDYNRLMNEALWYSHQEVPAKTLKAEFLKFAATIDKDKAKDLAREYDEQFQKRLESFYDAAVKKHTRDEVDSRGWKVS